MTTADDVAQWMVDEVMRRGTLDQETAAHQIRMKFGKDFTYTNENGNWAIDRKVLSAFKKLTGDTVVWDRSYREWRKRQTYDKPGRQQD
jgi:hypothetical protein